MKADYTTYQDHTSKPPLLSSEDIGHIMPRLSSFHDIAEDMCSGRCLMYFGHLDGYKVVLQLFTGEIIDRWRGKALIYSTDESFVIADISTRISHKKLDDAYVEICRKLDRQMSVLDATSRRCSCC